MPGNSPRAARALELEEDGSLETARTLNAGSAANALNTEPPCLPVAPKTVTSFAIVPRFNPAENVKI